MYDLYKCIRCLRLSSSASIVFSTVHESTSSGVTIAVYSSNNNLLLYHIIENADSHAKEQSQNAIIKQIPIDDRRCPLKWMCFDGTGSWLMTIDECARICLIPIRSVLSSNSTFIDCDATIIDTCTLRSPSSIVWWKCINDNNEIAIVGNDYGEISFIDLKLKTEIGGTYVHNSIKELSIINDKNSVSLLVTCVNGSQWHLTLEETRRKVKTESFDRSDHYQQQSYFTCFITSNDEREIGPNNCWNIKPKLIELIDEEFNRECQSSHLTFHSPFLIGISSVQKDNIQTIVRLMPQNDFNYDFTSSIYKYIIPKISSVENVLLTDRLLFIAESKKCLIVSREFSDSRKLAKLNSIIQEFDFNDEIILSIIKLHETDSDGLINSFIIVTNHSIFKCQPKYSCQMMFNSIIKCITCTSFASSPSPLSITSDAAASIKGQRFGAMLGLNIQSLYEKSAEMSLETHEFSTAVRYYTFAKTPQLKRIAQFLSHGYVREVIEYIQYLFSSRTYEIEDPDKGHFANILINCMVKEILEKRVNNEHETIVNSLKSFIRDNPFYDDRVVLRLFVEHQLYEMAEYCAKLRVQNASLLSYILKCDYLFAKSIGEFMYEKIIQSDFKEILLLSCKCQSYLNFVTSPDITYALILQKDLIAKYLKFIVKLLPSLDMPFLHRIAMIFDPRRDTTQLLLNRVLSQFKNAYLSSDETDEQMVQKKDILNLIIFITLMVMRQNKNVNNFKENFITIEPFVKNIDTNKKKLIIETVEIGCGQSHSAFIRNGCLYVWGKSRYGCLGLDTDKCQAQEIVPLPSCVELFKDTMAISVKSVSCGNTHTLVLTDFGVYSFGSSRYGQLGLGNDVRLSRCPILINELIDKDIVKINCGSYHSLAITADGDLYTWGWGLHGQNGHGTVEDVYVPKKVNSLSNVVSACGGYAHSIVLDSNGDVYSFGNSLFGQLGLATNVKHSLPQKITLIPESIKLIASKYFHTLALSSNGKKLYVWGLNPQVIRIHAQYLRKSRFLQQQPSIISLNQDHLVPVTIDISHVNGEIAKMCVGSMHSLLLTVNGGIYSFGRGNDGQLGHGKLKETKIPVMIMSLNDQIIVDIATGSDFSVAIDATGSLWGWGQNTDCQIGPNSSSDASATNMEDKNKKITIRTSRRVFTFIPGGKTIQTIPTRIVVPDNDGSYCDSLNYSYDISTMKESMRYSLFNDTKTFAHKDLHIFDENVLAIVLVSYYNELDLNSVLQRFISFRCFQIAAFVCELQKNFSKALELQLNALVASRNDSNEIISLSSKILCTFVPKVLQSQDDGVKLIVAFVEFWFRNKFDSNKLENVIIDCYKQSIRDCMFGITFFNYLNQNKEIKERFTTFFLLDMVEYTIKIMTKNPQQLFLYQSTVERITSDMENLSFPTEKLWQNILSNINCFSNDTGVEVISLEPEVMVFTCKHYYGISEFKMIVLPNFERDINQLKGIAETELFNLLKLFNDPSKDSWESELCPKCIINEFRSKHVSA